MTADSLEIKDVGSAADMGIVRELFEEYAAWLGVDLCFQGFQQELESLPGPYARPGGFIFLAKCGGEPAGCIALKPLPDGACEMKRLYVRPTFRGTGLGRRLVQLCLDEATAIGYEVMRLDTLRRMEAAISLYRSFDFSECGGYYNNPLDDVVYMERALAKTR